MNAITSVRVLVDAENNAELFWESFRERLPALESADPEVYDLCKRLERHDEVEITDPAAIQRFANFVENLPGYSDGPEHAKQSLIWQAE